MILKADGPAVRILWSIDCNEACVTAAVRTRERQTDTLLAGTLIYWRGCFFMNVETLYFAHSPNPNPNPRY